MKTLDKVIKSSTMVVHKGRFAYLKAKKASLGKHFLVSQDKDEITIVTEEKNIKGIKYDKIEKWFKLFEIKVALPFYAVGFLAKIAKAIVGKKLNILIISTFSKDYILIREAKYEIAVKDLKKLGFPVKIEMSEKP